MEYANKIWVDKGQGFSGEPDFATSFVETSEVEKATSDGAVSGERSWKE